MCTSTNRKRRKRRTGRRRGEECEKPNPQKRDGGTFCAAGPGRRPVRTGEVPRRPQPSLPSCFPGNRMSTLCAQSRSSWIWLQSSEARRHPSRKREEYHPTRTALRRRPIHYGNAKSPQRHMREAGRLEPKASSARYRRIPPSDTSRGCAPKEPRPRAR